MSAVAGIVVAAGRSDRFGGGEPKQFRDLAGLTVVERAVDSLASHPHLRGVVVVLAADSVGGPRAAGLAARRGVLAVVAGGASRAASVGLGLEAIGDAEFVLVHDGARPFPSPTLVDAVLEATLRHGAAVPAVPVPDTVKEVDDAAFIVGTVDRRRLRLAQTPQGARVDWLRDALRRAGREGIDPTDEAHALERAGHRVAVVSGQTANVKITVPEDLEHARLRLEEGARKGALARVGTGFDLHRFGGERALVLGGVTFPGETGLVGHSDADVVLHAVMDALLGAAGLNDIGAFFPPDDPRYEGADSRDLARRVGEEIRRAGFVIGNVDLTVLAERPRVLDKVGAMREAMSACLGIGPARIGVKATTLEGVGALGRGEGIACQAVALLFESSR